MAVSDKVKGDLGPIAPRRMAGESDFAGHCARGFQQGDDSGPSDGTLGLPEYDDDVLPLVFENLEILRWPRMTLKTPTFMKWWTLG